MGGVKDYLTSKIWAFHLNHLLKWNKKEFCWPIELKRHWVSQSQLEDTGVLTVFLQMFPTFCALLWPASFSGWFSSSIARNSQAPILLVLQPQVESRTSSSIVPAKVRGAVPDLVSLAHFAPAVWISRVQGWIPKELRTGSLCLNLTDWKQVT